MYRPTIGLEVHAQLKTQTKMFCQSANNPDETIPNTHVCPICLAHPGTLPVINKQAVAHIVRVGTAIGGQLADFTEFDRKSYFYPDIPKGYQISQYEHPLVQGGTLAGVAITRVHLEEDTARSTHTTGTDSEKSGKSLVDFNRAGIPLMELVTEPVIEDAETAGRFARELQLLLRTLGASDANLEKGEMRIEANISVRPESGEGSQKFGTKVEVKNINSFRSVERAIAYEIERQTALLERGGKVVQETRGWNEGKQETFHQRFKEGSADYRYFPEPDLPKLILSDLSEFSADVLKASLPELPWERRARYTTAFGLKQEDTAFLVASTDRSEFFDAVVRALDNDKTLVSLAANYILSDLVGIFAKKSIEQYQTIAPTGFAKLIRLVATSSLSSRGAKDTLAIFVDEGGDPEVIAKEHNLMQVHDESILDTFVDAVIASEVKAVEEFRAGKEASLQYLIGKTMKESRGAGNPASIKKILLTKLG